ncbi:MAG: helix-turn-helix transcriptional regulator [Anaerolineales bacterium]|nr:helix-turn-helix transcriptional regulator [Anaerolineales bacterium]
MPDSYQPLDFAQRLEALFEEKGLKAAYVARKVGISKVYLSRLRNGKATNPGFTVIQALAEVFGVSAAYFFGEQDAPGSFDEVTMRAGSLDQRARKAINDILTYIAKIQVENEFKEPPDNAP